MKMSNISELFKALCEENQTRKILAILLECKDLNEAIGRVKSLIAK